MSGRTLVGVGGGEDFGCLILPRSCGIPHVREILNWGRCELGKGVKEEGWKD